MRTRPLATPRDGRRLAGKQRRGGRATDFCLSRESRKLFLSTHVRNPIEVKGDTSLKPWNSRSLLPAPARRCTVSKSVTLLTEPSSRRKCSTAATCGLSLRMELIQRSSAVLRSDTTFSSRALLNR